MGQTQAKAQPCASPGDGGQVRPEGGAGPRHGDAATCETAPLGIYGKYSATSQAQRREKYILQSAARKLRQGFPVTRCLRWAIPKSHISILHYPEFGKAGYGGLETCGSVWECPVCASKISERRRVEVQSAMATHKAQGGQVLLLTLTNAHRMGDDLPSMLAAQAKAIDGFRKNRAGRRFFDSIGTVGTIRALEVTHGQNGWHPHFHILLFVSHSVDMAKAYRSAYAVWAAECMKAGLGIPSFKHGVSLQDGSHAEKYVSKWGLENEITKGHIKKAKAGGRGPFDLLRSYTDGDKQAGALFVQYATHFKGKRQLVWSHGLKAKFAIEEASDLELAEREEERATVGMEISRDDWKIIISYDVRAEILEAYENLGPFEAAHCIAILRGDVPTVGQSLAGSQVLTDTAEWMNWTPERRAEFALWLEEQSVCH